MNLRKLMNNRFVLYAMYLLALFNILGYLSNQDMDSLVLFSALGYLSSYFSKNMVVNLSVAILVTKFHLMKQMEGMTRGQPKKKKDEDDDEKDPTTNRIDTETNLKEGYKQLEKMLGGAGMQSLAADSQTLAKQQRSLLKSVEQMQPMLNQLGSMVNQFGGANGISNMVKSLDKFKK
jgi:hypothetical protein